VALEPAAALPNLGDPGLPALAATFLAFIGGAVERALGGSWDQVQAAAFKAGFIGTGLGIAVYFFGLVSGLY
jgi:hypothetical protein